jgi:arylsulfatase A
MKTDSHILFYDFAGNQLGKMLTDESQLIKLDNDPGVLIYEFRSTENQPIIGKIVALNADVQIKTIHNSPSAFSNLKGLSSDEYILNYIDEKDSLVYADTIVVSGDSTIFWNVCKEDTSKYLLTVNEGTIVESSDSFFAEGTVVNINANPASEGMQFDQWTGDVFAVEDIYSANTYLTMPAEDVTVTATYKAILKYTLSVLNGAGNGEYSEGDSVEISADVLGYGKVFDHWTGDSSVISDVNNPYVIVIMPDHNVSFTANYKTLSIVAWPPAGMVNLISVIDGKGLKVSNGAVGLAKPTSNYDMLWTVTPKDDTYDYISNAETKEKLAIKTGLTPRLRDSTTTITKVQWEAIDAGDGSYYLFNKSYNTYLSNDKGTLAASETQKIAAGKWYPVEVILSNLTVNNGTGSGIFGNGAQVVIKADAPAEGQVFDKWTGDITGLKNIYSANTVLTMPDSDVSVTPAYKAEPANQPNIILFFIDDWAWNGSPILMNPDMPNSAMPLLQMPNLEQLASEGMKFNNAYSGAPQCSPSRASIQTGQSAPHNRYTVFMGNHGGDPYYDLSSSYASNPSIACVSDMYLDDEEYSVAKALNPLGYICAHYGKWHMRGNPVDYGYPYNDGETTNNEGNLNIVGDPKQMFSLTERSISFMEDQVAAKKPFYLQISHWAMHAGSECLQSTRDKYQETPELQAYYASQGIEDPDLLDNKSDPAVWFAMGENLDSCLGMVMKTVQDLGIEDNTYILLTSDNGYRHHELDIFNDITQPLHGAKWWLWEGGTRVPMVVKGPGIPANSSNEVPVVNYDFLPTFFEWAGGDPEQSLSDLDGVSLSNLFHGNTPSTELLSRNIYFHYPHYRTSLPMSTLVSAGKWKLVHFYDYPDVPMLFDLENDIGEVNNIADTESEIHSVLFEKMKTYLNEVGARIPFYPNPNYDENLYLSDPDNVKKLEWGPFTGSRPLEYDE